MGAKSITIYGCVGMEAIAKEYYSIINPLMMAFSLV